jgi:hypothetical protein
MNITEYTQLMNKPNAVSELQTIGLEKYWWVPLFSKCTRLKIKGLYNQNSFKYNFALKVTAHTQPTEVFCLISLLLIHLMPFKNIFEKKKQELLNITVIDSHEISIQKKSKNHHFTWAIDTFFY